jgi:hypothetical protein
MQAPAGRTYANQKLFSKKVSFLFCSEPPFSALQPSLAVYIHSVLFNNKKTVYPAGPGARTFHVRRKPPAQIFFFNEKILLHFLY